MSLRFPDHFLFGAASSAYQIEGAADEDGRGPSIWDNFCRTPGKVVHGDTGDIACDHYHRVDADLDLIAGLGLDTYRFSIAWPRIMPDGRGGPNQKGLDFYRRLVEGLRERGITPMATLYHWDLPQPLQDAGGWAARDTVDRFTDYAQVVLDQLGTEVPLWVTMNEPFCTAMVGYLQGRHAPGLIDLESALRASHHVLLSHGRAVQLVRAAAPAAEVGIAVNLADIAAASQEEADVAAAARLDGYENRWYLDPLFGRGYPADMLAWYGRSASTDFVRDGDLAVIAAPTDFLGINYYETKVVAHDPAEPFHEAREIRYAGRDATAGGLDPRPAGLGRILHRIHDHYTGQPLYITENGAAFHDYPDPDGQVNDLERVRYLNDHFAEAAAAIEAGINLRGYYIWALIDNLEWADGYSRRFGLVYVDYPTQTRTPKASALWYQRLIAGQRATCGAATSPTE
jgi:beta-glucosidase